MDLAFLSEQFFSLYFLKVIVPFLSSIGNILRICLTADNKPEKMSGHTHEEAKSSRVRKLSFPDWKCLTLEIPMPTVFPATQHPRRPRGK